MSARRVLVVLFVPVLVAAFAACSSSAKQSESSSATPTSTASGLPEVTMTAADYGFNIPTAIPSGQVKVTLVNKGTAPEGHQLQLVKLGSLSFDEFKTKAATADLKGMPADTIFVGGPNIVDPGKSASAILTVEPGDYGVACYLVDAKVQRHTALGMVAKTTVQPSAPTSAPVIKTAGTITLTDFAFTVPRPFTGKGTFEVKNIGKQVHELGFFRVAPGATAEQAKKYVLAFPPPPGAPPAIAVPGMTGLSKGHSGVLDLQLAPGTYIAVCFFPDIEKGDVPHAFADKMVSEIVVT